MWGWVDSAALIKSFKFYRNRAICISRVRYDKGINNIN